MAGINRHKIRRYNLDDPRYNFTIGDSDKYNATIYPLHMEKKCNNTEKFNNFVKNEYPPISRCWSQGYENCSVLKPPCRDCQCSKCILNIYDDPGSTVTWKTRSDFNPKNLSPNIFYDKMRINKTTHANLNIDRSPDTCIKSGNHVSKHNAKYIGRVNSKSHGDNTIEHYNNKHKHNSNAVGLSCNACVTCCGSIVKICPFCPSWIEPNSAGIIYSLCIMICICLPCICACLKR